MGYRLEYTEMGNYLPINPGICKKEKKHLRVLKEALLQSRISCWYTNLLWEGEFLNLCLQGKHKCKGSIYWEDQFLQVELKIFPVAISIRKTAMLDFL